MDSLIFDFKIKTFLTLCNTMNFTKAAQQLHITQPAVSQHIKLLQEQLDVQLFNYKGRQLTLTEAGMRLKTFTLSLQQDINRFSNNLQNSEEQPLLCFGATRTIGEFTLPPLLEKMIANKPQRKLSLYIDNTEILLEMLDTGKIDFAFIEGAFDKTSYSYRLFSHQNFIAIGSKEVQKRYPKAKLEQLFEERLIIREKGSGTRKVLEQILNERGLTTESFSHIDEIGNPNVIKYLVEQDKGISFMYEEGAKEAIKEDKIVKLDIQGWQVIREFNFVYPLYSHYEQQFLDFYSEIYSYYTH